MDPAYIYELRRPDGTVLYRNVKMPGQGDTSVDLPLGPNPKGIVETWLKRGDGDFELRFTRDFDAPEKGTT